MGDEIAPLDGVIVPVETLAVPRARALAELVGAYRLRYVRLVECRQTAGTDDEGPSEIIVIDVEVERPQCPVHDIRREERLALVFAEDDSSYPEVVALRASFPRVPHLNFRDQEVPRSLCLFDRPWSEVAFRWTPTTFIKRIRYWLAQTAKGLLHQEDQPLEALLFDNGYRIVLPADIYSELAADKPIQLDAQLVGPRDAERTFVTRKPGGFGATAPRFVATMFAAKPQSHGVIRRSPKNIETLHEFLRAGDIDLIAGLRERLAEWKESRLLDARLIIIVALPLTRTVAGATESWDFWAFVTLEKTVRAIGVEIGLWNIHEGVPGLLIPPDEERRGQGVKVLLLSPYMEFSRNGAATANGIEADACKTVAVGAGALGSQVIDCLVRSGFGTWTIVDEDHLLPHNLARHVLDKNYVGQTKAAGVAHKLRQLYESDGAPRGIATDVLRPDEKAEELTTACAAAELILDVAASVPVARYLAIDVDSPARRVSVFLSPQGTDLVVLSEDAGRELSLDTLEAQYYRAAATETQLAGHLDANPGRLRYGRSCRDITTSMPTYAVTMNAAIASEAVRNARHSSNASIRIWRSDLATLAVSAIKIEPVRSQRQTLGDWTLTVDERLLDKLNSLRAGELPNETGGVLIGMYDLPRRRIYVVDAIASPPDSVQRRDIYIRGCEDLSDRVQELADRSGGQLEYVGEWHSHPDGCATSPSEDDIMVFSWLTGHMADVGLPALAAIVGEDHGSSWYLGQMAQGEGWRVEP
jgi:integrative and conjugative element protein (TIGR02256 family)